MKRRKFIRHPEVGGSAAYMGIGHTGGGAVVWAYVDGRLETWTDSRTHQDMYGNERFDYWRGRYEGFTGKLSIVAPSGTNYRSPPRWLTDKLEAEFGGDFEIHSFNPPKRNSK